MKRSGLRIDGRHVLTWDEGSGHVNLIEAEVRRDGVYEESGDYYYDDGHSFTRTEARALARAFRHFAENGTLAGFTDSGGILKAVEVV